MMKLLHIFLALLIMASMSNSQPPVGSTTCPVPKDECEEACNVRCSQKGHKKRCLFYCNHCCGWCQCVPPGYVGENKDCCSCYNEWKKQTGEPKCP
ncbi:hypothetical protein P3S68_015135 [Capsicum galapagoense]